MGLEEREAQLKINEKALMRIINHNLLYEPFNPELGLLKGRMGVVLFFFHYARYVQNTLYEDFAGDILDDIYEDITNETSIYSLCDIGWGILYLFQQGFVEGDVNDILEIIDRRIEMQSFQHTNETEHYLCFRLALIHKESAEYSSSEIMQRFMSCMDTDELSWLKGLKMIWDETVIHH